MTMPQISWIDYADPAAPDLGRDALRASAEVAELGWTGWLNESFLGNFSYYLSRGDRSLSGTAFRSAEAAQLHAQRALDTEYLWT